MKYYSQFGQDKWLNENIFKNKQDGFFLEIGADDGIDKSNTKLFEEKGWRGICIEPSPSRFNLLRENRSCIVENVAISDQEGEAEFLDIQGYGKGLSGIVSEYHGNHRTRIDLELKNTENKGSRILKVKTCTLNSIFTKYGLKKIDYCSIDTEGSEYKILKDFDFDNFASEVFLIENNYHDSKVDNILSKNSYKKIFSIKIDDVYVRNH
jgi:FkbM family methyltransferase